ncbi:regucalcin-like isoform X1 [Portunus trituberculatus]|nr:regucalcin-like isoform X1 [Portunus trituberculatus]
MAVVERLPVPCLKLGEGPHWLPQENCLLFVDVFTKALRKYNVDTKKEEVLYLDDPDAHRAAMVMPVEGEDQVYMVGLGKTLSVVRWPKGVTDSRPVKLQVVYRTEDPHMNDGKCDGKGRLWFGTMTYLDEKEVPAGHEDSSLYRCDHNLQVTLWKDKVTISNGLAWSLDHKFLYHVDSTPGLIYVFDYNLEEGTAVNPRVLFSFKENGLGDQSPDGMTIDADGNLWIACFGGGQVICVNPVTRKIVKKVSVPSPHVTSACFGGPDLATLFITTGTLRLSEEEKTQYPEAGSTYAVTGLGVKGLPANVFKCDVGKLKEVMNQ